MTKDKLLKKLIFKNSHGYIVGGDENIKVIFRHFNTKSPNKIIETEENLKFFIDNDLGFNLSIYYGKNTQARYYYVRFRDDGILYTKEFTSYNESDIFKYQVYNVLKIT